MKITKAVGKFLGVSGDRSAPPPRYLALADGLTVTETHAEAWYVLSSSNTDLMSETARDAEHDQASSALARILAGQDCHLRILWSPLNAADYRVEAEELFTAGDFAAWADARVERLDDLALSQRQLLLGVRIQERSGQTQARSRSGVQDAFGIRKTGIPQRELARLDALARRLGRQLETTPWRAKPAPVEVLAWMIAREQHRATSLPTPNSAGVISGAKLAALTRGRVVPYPDHVRVMDAQGEVAAWTSVLTMDSFPEEMESPGPGSGCGRSARSRTYPSTTRTASTPMFRSSPSTPNRPCASRSCTGATR
ncbi:hypothetical protein SHKM778_95180 (plasmid) [Streptomyces sp. KM77-8]|uniref:Uncharacterized protein n=1 Tax=Streptomyces haneummycinicus TaxID=3074435 RepID=A0AAT9I0E6_9ACTN